ncbi:dystonin isoform X3 [Carettochelys insculpta]|uniref:dystonin isoform X3 n=1 Tax=Carettochelys insculpta TaxID=44489 RepID=UPI003EB719A7
MIAAAFLVLLRPYSIQCALFLLLLLVGTVATILFFCCWHRRLQKGRHPIKSVLSGRSRSRDAVMRTHHFRSEGFRPSPRHARRRVAPRLEETQPLAEVHHLSEQETSVRKRKIKKNSRVQPEFYHSVQVTPTRKPSSGNASYRCSMSSSADFSDEDDFSQKSGSLSPAPGDTLPWNLPKHERSKRKIQGGSVLDPAERAVLRIADERDKVQKKTFTKWINQHLMKVRKHVNDLYEDLRDGHNLISLLEVLSGDTLPRERDFLKTLRLVSSTEACTYEQHEDVEDEDKGPREKGRMRFHRLQNVQIALDYLKKRQVKLVNIRNDDITDGNPKLTLGLIWTIILHFQISDIHVTGESEDMSAKERLLLWTQQTTEGYAGIRCENFTTCWRDGKLFNAIIHKYRPDLIDMNTVAVQSNLANLEHAFYVAEKLGVTRLLDPEDVDVSSPDEKSVITYVSSLYDAFPKVPEGGEGISANDVEVKWVEYQNMVNYLIQWIRHHVTIMSERTFPNNPVELKALYNQYLQFKETEIPPKEIDKSKIKRFYKLLEVWIEFGRIKLPQGYHPNDIEKEWGKLIIAMLEREKTLRPEVERLEMLQQIANRVQRDSLSCEDKLILARNALQSDAKRLESGLQFQNEAEIAGYLLECENLLRQQVIDVQILIDGKYYQADQLVQRVAKVRDDLMALRTECSSIFSKGRSLTTEQTKLMISGITQSLNSGFAPNLNPDLNSGMTQNLTPSLTSSSLTSGLSSGLTSRLTPAITPAYTPGFPPRVIQTYVPGVDTNALQTLKLMQIRKPLMKSAFVDQNLTEEEVNMKFVQDLLNWVDEMQVQLDRTEWGSDLPSVESHLENHKNVHRAIEEFESSLKEAKISEIQMTAPLKLSYAEKLHKLESQYAKLLHTSRNQERHLDTLHNFVSRATGELIWLNEKEEEEVSYDWSERNSNISRKKEYHADLMRELDQKEEVIKSVQEIAEQLLLENHPARLTIEAYKAAMQTQWSWILQLCHCVEQHLRENAAYFEFFNDAKEATDYLRNLKDAIQRKYSCDRSSSLHKLEDLVQESMEEKEQLLQYKSTVAGLVGKAKAIIQLKHRNPDSPLKTSIPIKAICDYRQIEITIYKDDECVLASNAHRAKWKVISPSGNEAMVPSVCFTVPPPNKEAIDTANRIEQHFQNVLALWHESHINMKSVVSWHYLTNEIETVRAGNVASIKTMLPGEHQQVLSNLQSRFADFLEDSEDSKIFSASDIAHLEREVNICKQYYQELLKSAEREEQEESIYNLYISEVRNIRLRLESCEDRLIRQIRTPLERDDLHESVFRISEQEKLKKELDRLKDDLGIITDKCEEFFSQAAGSPSVPTLRSELNVIIQNMNQVYSMSSIYIEKLKTVNLVLKNTQGAEALVKLYETKLCEEEAVTADKNNIENLMGTLKQWRSEVDEKREVFHALEDELQKAKAISDQMFKTHKERDLDFDWHKEKADQLSERWQNVHSQIENRLRDLEGISKSLKYYKDTYHTLDTWIQQVEDTQRKIQENQPANSKALAKQLNQQKMLVSEIEMKQNKIDECQKYSEQYSAAVKDYELQTMTYRAMVDSQQKSPVKRRRMQSSSDFIIQEFMDLRTRYTALVTLMTQYIKFAGDSLKRLEEEEKSVEEEKKEHVQKAGDLLKWVSDISKTLSKGEGEKSEKADLLKQQISSDELATKKEQISEALQTTQSFLAKHSDKMTDRERNEIEKQVKSLQEGYNLLSNETLKQLQEAQNFGDEKMEEKVDKVIAGIIDQTTGEVLSVFQSVLKGLIDSDTGIRLLETQLILSGLISPELGACFDLEEAKAHELIDEQTLLQLQKLNNAKKIISESSFTNFPAVAALEQGIIPETLAIKILEIQLSKGYLVMPSTGERFTLNKAFQNHLISASLFSKLLERQDTCKDLIDPNTAEKISLEEMVQRSIISDKTGLKLLPVKPQESGRITLKCGRKISILRAAHEGLIDRETMFRLLGAQVLSGGIIDPYLGQRVTVEEAMRQELIDQDTACGILTHQIQTGGILSSKSSKRLTVDEAIQCNLISSSSALLVLEAQRGFIGIIWPQSGEIFPVSTSLHQGMITNELASKILNGREKIAALYIPETCEVLSLDKAAQLGVIDGNTLSVLNNVILPDKMPNMEDLEFSCNNTGRWVSSAFHDCRKEQEVSDTEESMPHSLEQAKKLFMSYLMINSYMDANTGQRLLLYDGDLEEAVSMLLEGDDSVSSTDVAEGRFSNRCVNSERIDLKLPEKVMFNNVTSNEHTDVQNTFTDSNLKQPENMKNDKRSEREDFHTRANEFNANVFEQAEGRLNSLTSKSEAVTGNLVGSTQNLEKEKAFRSFQEYPEHTQMKQCEQVYQQANSGNIEKYHKEIEGYSLGDLISGKSGDKSSIPDGRESLDRETKICTTSEYSLDVNDLSVKSEVSAAQESNPKCGHHIWKSDAKSMLADEDVKICDFQSSLNSFSHTDIENRLLRELSGKKLMSHIVYKEHKHVTPQSSENEHWCTNRPDRPVPEDNSGSYYRPLLKNGIDAHGRSPLGDSADLHGGPLLEGQIDLCGGPPTKDTTAAHDRVLLEDVIDIHRGPLVGDSNDTPGGLLLGHSTGKNGGPLLGNSISLRGDLLLGDSSAVCGRLLLDDYCYKAHDPLLGESEDTPQFENGCWQREDDDDAYDTAQVDDDDDDDDDDDESYNTAQFGDDDGDDDDAYDTSQVDGDDSYESPQIDGDYDTSQLEDVDDLESDNMPVSVQEQRDELVNVKEELNSFQEDLSNCGDHIRCHSELCPTESSEIINVASVRASMMEAISEEETENIGNLGEKAQTLPIMIESEESKERRFNPLLKLHGTGVQEDRYEECETQTKSDSTEDEHEGMQEEEEENYDYMDYDSDRYDGTDDDDDDEVMDIYYSRHQNKNGIQLFAPSKEMEGSDERNQNIDSSADYLNLKHLAGDILQLDPNSQNTNLCPEKYCLEKHKTVSDVSEEGSLDLAAKTQEERQQKIESASENFVGKNILKDMTKNIQPQNITGAERMLSNSEESNFMQHRTLTSDPDMNDAIGTDPIITHGGSPCASPSAISKQAAAANIQTQIDLHPSGDLLPVPIITKNDSNISMPCSNCVQKQNTDEDVPVEQISNNVTGVELLKVNSSQMDNIIVRHASYVNDSDSLGGLTDLVHSVTNNKELGQIGVRIETPQQNKDIVTTRKESHSQELNKSPIHMESLGEIFVASVRKGREIAVSNDGRVSVEQASSTATSGHYSDDDTVQSDEFMQEFDLSAYLKQCAKGIKGKDILQLVKANSFYIKEVETDENYIQNGKELVIPDHIIDMGAVHPEDLHAKAQSSPLTVTVKSKEINISKENISVCQEVDKILNDTSEKDTIFGHEFGFKKAETARCIENVQKLEDRAEMRHSGSHRGAAGFSSGPLDNIGDRLDDVVLKEYETLVCCSGVEHVTEQSILTNTTTLTENSVGKDKTAESLHKEMMLPEDLKVGEGILHSPYVSDTLIEDLKNILKKKLKDGHVFCKQEGEPLNYSDTKVLMQNLLKMISYVHMENEPSTESNIKQTSDDISAALVATPSCKDQKDYDNLQLSWPDNRRPDLLLDILKQHHCIQKTDNLFETSEERQNGRDQEIKAVDPKRVISQLEQIFQIPPGGESSYKLEELMSTLAKDLFTTSQMADSSTDSECVSKAEELYTLSTGLTEFGSRTLRGNSLVHSSTAILKDDQQPEKSDGLSKNFSENVLKMKEAARGDNREGMVFSAVQQCLKYTDKLRGHLTVVQDMKFHLDNQQPVSNNLEMLKTQLEQLESFESELATFAAVLKKDMKLTEEFLKSKQKDGPKEQLKELKTTYEFLQKAFFVICDMSSKRAKQIVFAVDSEMSKLAILHQGLLSRLQEFSDWITENHEIVNNLPVNRSDIENVKQSLQLLKNSSKELVCMKTHLDSIAFDVQFFISEHAQDLSPNQSKQLLRLLNSTQKCFQEVQETVTSQMESLERLLRTAQELGDQKDVAEQQQECKEKLQEICDLFTQTENRLIGQQEALVIGDSKAELKQYQTKQEELQKDMQASAQALAEIVKNTEMFLKENGEKLSQEDKTVLEQKLNEAKTKCLLLSQKAEESKKELDKAVTTAIKQETEKVAAIEQLEESKNTIENLLDWLSDVDKAVEHGDEKWTPAIEQNGTHFKEQDIKVLKGEEDEVNGNLLELQQQTETQVDGRVKPTESNLNQQYQKVKAQHEKIISQQQAVIIATQSAQALLEKQGHYLSPEEKEKMQRNMKELKMQYETALAEAERKMKLTHSLQEELEKFDTDYCEFENWLQQSEQQLENLEAGASDFAGLMTKLKRQKSFSEDVISHKGDLRYITISGQRVLDAAKSCSKKIDEDGIDISATYTEVQSKLDGASDRFKSLYTKCGILGNNLKDLVDKYQHYEEASSGLLSCLQNSEIAVNKQLSEPIAVDPENLQRQLEETKVLQGQVSSHQVAIEKLKKAAEVLLDTRGALLPDNAEIQKTLDGIVGRYDCLSKSVNERNEKLQITLTRSLSVQDGLDEMLDWMGGVEKSLEEQGQMPLNSTAIQDLISKNIMLEQDIAGRQSSLIAMNEKVNKFIETTDPSTASCLHARMNELSVRFAEASTRHKRKLAKMEVLRTKVELFESLSEKLQSFLDKKTKALNETDAPGKDVSEVSQYMQETRTELVDHKKDLEVLHQLLEELSVHGLPGDKALVLEKLNALTKKFKEVEETVKEKEDDVSSCQEQMDSFKLHVDSLKKWMKETTDRIPAVQPSLNTEDLKKLLEDIRKLEEEWTSKAPEIHNMNSRGTSLCNIISAVTSLAKTRAAAKSSGIVLNGEGTASGSQGFLSNKELTAVQQAMSDVNHSYEDLGALLKENVTELESMLSKMQNVQEESNSVMQWLQKMDKAAASWEAAPTDREGVKTQVEQHKLFEAELKQSENKVQELKDKVTELLEKNPDSPEAPKWKQMLDKIDFKWQELNKVTADRRQNLEESSNYLTQFQTTEAQLKQWLTEKELMVSVLGPLSIDPNMLNTQKQQVQILLKEFDTRKSQYEQLTAAGQGILKRPGEHPPSHGIVKKQLAAVAQKWDSLTGQLSDRCGQIDQAIVKSREYQSLLRSLSEKLSALDHKLSSSLAVSTHPTAMKQQLEKAIEVKQEIEQEMKNIKVAQVLCEELSALVGEEYLKAELTRQLEGILKPFMDIEQKAGNHVQQLQSAYATSHQFQQMSKDFQMWLDKKRGELNQVHPMSARLDSLQLLIGEQKDFKQTLYDQICSYEKIVAEGESLLQKTQGADRAELQSQLGMLKSNWDEINKEVREREDKLHDCLEKALKYKQHVEHLQSWIEKCQNNLSLVKIVIEPVEIEKSIAQVKALQKDLDKHHGMVESLNNAADNLLNATQTDKESVTEEKVALNQKVDMVTEQLQSKRESLENMARRLKEFQESSRETQRQLKSAKEQLEAHDALGPQVCSNKYLTMLQSQQKVLQTLKPHVDLAKKLAQELVVDASSSEGVSDLLLQAESLEQEYRTVSQQVEDKCSFLETKLQGIGHFQNSIREMFSQFAEFDDELDSMAPAGRDLDTLRSQREDIKNFLKKLQDLITSNENANKTCKMMLDTEASPDLIGIKRDLEALSKQCNKLLDRAKAREEQVEGTLCRMEEFYSKLKEFSSLLGGAEEHEESQGPVGMETDIINQQLNTFKVFQKEEIETLQAKQQEVNWLGQGLIQSAAKTTSTENLEHDLEEVNTRWKTLNKKVAQRAAQLQEALLRCGRFQDALESLLSWLIDTEDLVANQKPPSAEFKVVKAQIQEQKLLQKLLDDRRPTVEVSKREGEKIAESAEPADKVKILKQLSLLDSRWEALLSKAETRNRQLEGILVVAQQFHETLEPLVEWLTTTEKRLANSEPIGTQASKLQQQISQHKALEDDILSRNKSLHMAISIGQSLKNLSSREDKDMVQEKLDSSQARYIEIQEKSNSRSELLQQAYCNAQIFGEDEVELMNWLNEVHDKLSKLSVQDYSTDSLVNQHTDLLVLQEEILLRKQNVDQAIQNGLELLKQTTGDEVVIIQDKLEGIKARYKDITKLSSDVSKTLEQALQLAGQLQSTHEELCIWLDKVEVELLSYDAQIHKGEELSEAQERQKELKKEAKNKKGLLDTLNEVSSALLELVPWRAREGLDKMVNEDNERYRLVSDTLTQKVEEIDAAALRSQQFDQAADAELAWIAETEKKLMSLGDIRLEQDQTAAQLQVQKAFTMEILRHKDAIDELVETGDEIMTTCTEEEKQSMKRKLESLLQKYDMVCQMNAERNLQLERAQSLVNQFWETYEELWPWLTDIEMVISQLPAPALEYETLKQQQEEHRQLRELIAEHKPHIDKMNKTGPQLLELSPREGFCIQEKYVAADTLYSQIKEDVKKRALALDEAISQSTQFHDKIDPTLESLERIVERLRQPPSISAEVEKIKEQISENKNVSVDLEKLQPVYETLKKRGEEMIARSEGADKDISAKAVQDKLKQMVFIWEDIQALTEEREAKLLDVMDLAEKFWCDHMALVVTIKDTQDFIRELEGPGVDPSVVKQQQEAVETIKEEVDGLQEELDTVVNLGSELIAACGEPDKPIVNKSIDELNSAWDTLNKAWKERVDKLDEAMQAAVQYQDGLQAIFDWVDIAGSKLASMSPVGTDLETVKQQTEELKQFKMEAYQQQIEMERLNHQAELLFRKVTEESEKHTVQEPLSELKLMWVNLEEKIINRQHKLEGALLALGQFQHALDELLTWLTHTEDLLNEQKPVGGDPKAIEIELAKHHVLQNDVLAHQSTVETVKKAGNDLIESSAVEEASNLQSKLELLNQRWQNVLKKTEKRKQQLDSALVQAQGFHGEVEDMQQWLTDTERLLLASKPVGGLPETAREQLNAHMELCAAFEAKEETYNCLMQKGQQMLARCPGSAETNVEQDINNLKVKWDSVQTKLSERKTKLEEALNLAMEFHNSLQDFINWLTQAEQTLNVASKPSLILDTVLFQIDEHKVFATEVNAHRDQIIELDKTGTHLKYFSQKQDVVLIKNLLISVQSRWEKVVQRLVERGRALDDARKRTKQFHEAWNKLMTWLEESEKLLDSELEIANDPDKIKMQLTQHKEFQKSLGAKHSVYDTTNRTGRSLKEKTSLADDNLKLDDMLSELRDKWDTICGKSVERQNKLEEALLFSGQFTDALQALIDWLYKIEPQLAEDQPVHGDVDLVMNLIDNHKVFQKELGKKTSSVQALKRSARELIEGSRDDSSWVKVQMQELSTRWETVCTLSVSKQTRLEQALRQAEEFHSVVHVLLEWLAEAEQTLRFHGILPDDEEALRTLIDQHREFMRKLEDKKAELNKATGMGEAILAICHPDSITTIKHWITIIRARFEEVLAWAKQHQQRLAGALAGLIAKQELLEALLSWLQWAETTLSEKDKEVIPQEIEDVKALIAEHQNFMEEMTRKQPDVDKVTKTYKRKAAEPSPIQSHIPVLDKGRAGRKRSPTAGMYPSGAQAQIETKNPRVNLLVSKWQQVWLLALERRRKLNDALDRLEELREFANFDFDVWRKKYMRWMNHKKSRVMDFFRRIDKDQDGKITRQEFIDGILSSKFPTSRLEMSAVADIFDRDGDGYIDYYEFVAALHPNKDAYKPLTDADKIEDEVTRQVAKCKCAKRFQVEQIGDNKYRFFLGNQFGDSQQLRLVRILRSTVMVRVGGGWMALDEFLVKNDPCRVHHHGSKMLRSESNSSITTQPTIAKGRTNMELREKFIMADAASQNVAPFRPRGRRSRPSSRGASPNRSTSVSSQAGQGASPQVVATSTPKTPHPLTRNYGKPWLTNSKTSTPKPAESSDYQGSSAEGTPIQGSKLRLPGYLSGKGFHSGEDNSLISTAATRVRAQFADTRRTPSRPGSRAGSKAGSRSSSRRGSDASDFDISEIQSVCSDMSETVPSASRPQPRAGSRPASAKPSKIPTPQRRPPVSKLDKSSKR